MPGYGAPPMQPCYGAPPPFGAMPPQGYGMPPPGYGMPPGYGAMPPMGFGGDRAAPYGVPPCGATPLPPGWESTTDPASGKPYFFNRATNETRWDPPPAAAPVAQIAATSLPPGWESAPDPASGKP